MADLEQAVAEHYTTDALLDRINAALKAAGADPDSPKPEDLKPVDEFHTAGIDATHALLGQLDISGETRVLDIGCGLGGTARTIAALHGASVTGIDLTPLFVETALALTEMVGLSERLDFRVGSATELPVDSSEFDVAVMLHVGMNVADKAQLFREAARVLKPGGTFAVFDVMAGASPGQLLLPVPWSEGPETTFVEAPSVYRAAAEAAGFACISERDRSEHARAFFARVRAAIAASGPPPLGIHLLMRDTAGQKIENYVSCLDSGRIAPTEMIFRA